MVFSFHDVISKKYLQFGDTKEEAANTAVPVMVLGILIEWGLVLPYFESKDMKTHFEKGWNNNNSKIVVDRLHWTDLFPRFHISGEVCSEIPRKPPLEHPDGTTTQNFAPLTYNVVDFLTHIFQNQKEMTVEVAALWKKVAEKGDIDSSVFKHAYSKLVQEDKDKDFQPDPWVTGKPISDIDAKKDKDEKIDTMEKWAKDYHMKGQRLLHHLVMLKNLHDGSDSKAPRYVAKTHLKAPKKDKKEQLAVFYEKEADIWADRHQKPFEVALNSALFANSKSVVEIEVEKAIEDTLFVKKDEITQQFYESRFDDSDGRGKEKMIPYSENAWEIIDLKEKLEALEQDKTTRTEALKKIKDKYKAAEQKYTRLEQEAKENAKLLLKKNRDMEFKDALIDELQRRLGDSSMTQADLDLFRKDFFKDDEEDSSDDEDPNKNGPPPSKKQKTNREGPTAG